ncbi:hypothetical protein [Aliarcobacter butzleri]|uniref:hypothetical protein n=1 Tax=Aliarcobacter butzleri TaxID=28197 RepID=UPI0021B17C42|nr:hypothetical protein [Aliarcobacter butzleri]MCT7581416.1 hypothetical protein [Aliarcobacter butzleri]
MNNYNPKQAYFDRRNKIQKNNDRKRDNHQYSSSIGGCSCNYIVNSTTETKKTRKEK